LLASQGRACLNDRETGYREKEFKSQYQQDPPSSGSEESPGGLVDFVMSHPTPFQIAGVLMVVGGVGFGACERRPRK
jgi:hypothetical protein